MIDELSRIQEKLTQINYNDAPILPQDIHYIKKCCGYLRRLGIIRNQYQFSEHFLGKNKYYYGMILSEERHPSVASLHNLIKKMTDISTVYEQESNKQAERNYLEKLIEEGNGIITKRLFKYL